MSITLAAILKKAFIEGAGSKDAWTIPEIEDWLKSREEFAQSTWLSGGFSSGDTAVSKHFRLRDDSIIWITTAGIQEPQA